MSGRQCISVFLEIMDHEFPRYNQTLPFSGYKVDGQSGIKVHCNLNGLKSVDYFYEKKTQGKVCFIEFSDLERHRDSVNARLAEVGGAKPLTRATKKKILNTIGCEIHQELKTKYTDSLSILSRVERHIENIPEAFDCTDEEIVFHIVVPPLTEITEKDRLIDIIKFYDTLKDKVKAVIPSQMISDVIIYPVSKISAAL
ncbi:hypothetical protein [Aeromonas dhakensis]|uniref:hypothetical protein n=1 Tax=Aeromonas dhakensis TaxID=196024 RepID=UPI00300E5BD5